MDDERTLRLWVAYAMPLDFPRHVVVREQRLYGDHEVRQCFVACLFDTFEEAMRQYVGAGLTWIPRLPDDDPTIAGVWM